MSVPVFAQDFVFDQVIVQYDYSQGSYGLLSNDESDDIVVLTLSGETVQDAIQRLSSDPTVVSVQPNDPYFSSMWGLYNTGQTIE